MKRVAVTCLGICLILHTAVEAFAAEFTFQPRVATTEEYTDNLFLSQNNKKDDFITRVSAGFLAQLLERTSGLELAFDPTYSFYYNHSDLDKWGILSNLRAWTSPSQYTRIEVDDNFLRTTQPIGTGDRVVSGDQGLVEQGDTTVRRGRESYSRNTARFQASHQFGREDQVYGGFIYGLLRNDSDQVENNDYYRPSAGLNYWFNQRFGSQLFGEFTRGQYDQQSGFVGTPTSDFDNLSGRARFLARMSRHFSLFGQYNQIYRHFTSGEDNDYMVYAPSAGFTYDVTKDIYLRLGLGYYWQDIQNDKNQNHYFTNAEISESWNYQRGSIRLAALSGLTQNDFGAQNVGFQQFAALQGSALYNFTRRIVGDMTTYYRYSITPGQTDQPGANDVKVNQTQVNAGLSYLATRWMTIRLGYTFNWYDSTSANDDYRENRGLLTITLQPDHPWRF